MAWRAGLAAAAIVAATSHAVAQTPPSQPYAGMQARSVKALSDDQVADLRAGRGMGLALAAELNGYPGPSHLLELADDLKLTDQQRAGIRTLFETMKAESIPLGRELLAREAELDRQFADRSITQDRLAAAIAAIGEAQSRLRATHLKYHLLTPAILNEGQVRRYAELRGYAGGAQEQHQRHRRHHAN
jgi:Spy/CpxP family protein refolding chaperone